MLLNITSTGYELFRIVNIDDLEPLKLEVLVIFWRSGLEKSELRRNGWRQTKITCEQELL